MKGLEADQAHVLWLDSHGDFNTPETTPSGFLGGMPLAAMVGRGNQHLMTGIGLSAVAEDRIILTDGRDLDPEEGELVRESALTHYPNLRDLLEVDWTGKPLYIHFDCDVVCLDDLPAVSYPAQGGPTLAEMLDVLRAVTERADVRGVHVTCWNNQLAGAERSRDAVLAAIRVMVEALQA
jgi:arginase